MTAPCRVRRMSRYITVRPWFEHPKLTPWSPDGGHHAARAELRQASRRVSDGGNAPKSSVTWIFVLRRGPDSARRRCLYGRCSRSRHPFRGVLGLGWGVLPRTGRDAEHPPCVTPRHSYPMNGRSPESFDLKIDRSASATRSRRSLTQTSREQCRPVTHVFPLRVVLYAW